MLPQEILLNILSRLPPKSIGRCRYVSKPWRSLLSQPHFIKSHLKQTHHFSTQDDISLLFVCSDFSTLHTLKLTYDPTNSSPHMPAFGTELPLEGHNFSSTRVNVDTMASCDGMLLLKDEANKLLLLNPTTKEVQVLPTSPFALDPSVSHSLEGFGYDHVSDDYKVVTLSYYDAYYYEDYDDNDPNCNGIYINVYSVKNGTWKRCGRSSYDHAVGYPTSGVFVNGRIHWLASKSPHKSVLVAFDLGEERFYEVPPPSSVNQRFVFDRLVELSGCLCMFNSPAGGGTYVWMMKEYGVQESWTKFMVHDDKSEFRPVCLLGKEQMVAMKDMDDDFFAEKLLMYNLKEGTFRDIELQGVSGLFCVGGAFIESLVSPRIVDLQECPQQIY